MPLLRVYDNIVTRSNHSVERLVRPAVIEKKGIYVRAYGENPGVSFFGKDIDRMVILTAPQHGKCRKEKRRIPYSSGPYDEYPQALPAFLTSRFN